MKSKKTRSYVHIFSMWLHEKLGLYGYYGILSWLIDDGEIYQEA